MLTILLNFFYDKTVLRIPGRVILVLFGLVVFLGFQAQKFRLDASPETLVLENDRDFRFSRDISSRYKVSDYLVLTYRPKADLLSKHTLTQLRKLCSQLEQLTRVSSALSILDVPLLESPPIPIKDVASEFRTLESPQIELDLARVELKQSVLYQNLLVSPDLKTTALLVNFEPDTIHGELQARRDALRVLQEEGTLSYEERVELEVVSKEFADHRDAMKEQRHQDIVDIRKSWMCTVPDAELFLGGVGMIADDLITFIRQDLKVFGIGVFLFLILTLGILFRRVRWVLLPMICCVASVVSMVGLLAMFGWEVTVISSNFVSLQLIITMAITIHLTVRYRELARDAPEASQRSLVLETVASMIRPCWYAGLTTIAGFGSLLFSNILPVITFGWMMSAGIVVSLLLTFVLFPAVLMLMKRDRHLPLQGTGSSLTSGLAKLTERHGGLILVASIIAVLFSFFGIKRLEVENSFIDYFKKTTEIYQGMKVIDQHLGGTTPLDVVVEFDKGEGEPEPEFERGSEDAQDDFDDFSEFEEEEDSEKYWFTQKKMARVNEIHDYLDRLPETGKVLSLATLVKTAERLNENRPLDNLTLALLFSEIPDRFNNLLIKPYVSVEHDQVRFFVRIRDSEKSLKRDELLKRIRLDLREKLGIEEGRARLTGLLVLYNNMLQSLFASQIQTLGIVLASLMVMFLVLFRSWKIALIAIFPNALSVGFVLGLMGWLNIPLDMMTITIAAISVGIAVDDTIHYIHRFMREFSAKPNYIHAVHRCHGSIGYAMFYTSITIMIGFSILVLSNFIPSIYFGLLTALAMFIALVAALTLLPQLLVVFKPLGPEREG